MYRIYAFPDRLAVFPGERISFLYWFLCGKLYKNSFIYSSYVLCLWVHFFRLFGSVERHCVVGSDWFVSDDIVLYVVVYP